MRVRSTRVICKTAVRKGSKRNKGRVKKYNYVSGNKGERGGSRTPKRGEGDVRVGQRKGEKKTKKEQF